MFLMVKVIPNSHKNFLEGYQEGVLKVRIQTAPEKGKANEKLVEFLAESLHIPKKQIRIISGQTSRFKRLEIQEMSEASFLQKASKSCIVSFNPLW